MPAHRDLKSKKRFEQTELPKKLLDYLSWNNKSNINQCEHTVCLSIAAYFACVNCLRLFLYACLWNLRTTRWEGLLRLLSSWSENIIDHWYLRSILSISVLTLRAHVLVPLYYIIYCEWFNFTICLFLRYEIHVPLDLNVECVDCQCS